MKSPFPGMDPYIEASDLWADFHLQLIRSIRQALATTTSERYLVRIGLRTYVVLIDTEKMQSDLDLSDLRALSPKMPAPAPNLDGPTEPASMRAFIDLRYRESFVEIHETDPEERLVTCIEVLSPSNKQRGTEGWDLYQRRRQALLLGAANFIEIDLLRGGSKMPMLDPWPDAPCTLLLCRRSRAPYCKVWPGYYRQPLPTLPVPLGDTDRDMTLDLQPLIASVYDRARYHRSIDYSRPLSPPLSDEDQAWLSMQLAGRQPPAQ